jgi:Amidohydrolase
VSRVREPDYAVALCEAYNNYVCDHYVKVSERLKPIAIISPQDPERAAVELRRAVKQLGYRAAVVRTTGLRLPLGHRFYDPIYREAESLDCAIAVHGTNGGDELASGAFETFTEVHMVSFPVGIFVQFSNMIFQGVPERFPKLRLAFLEIGCSWLPYWLDRMDEHWEKRGKIETPLLAQRPSDCVRQRPIFFSLESEEGGNFPLRRRRPFLIRHRYPALGQRVSGKSAEGSKTGGSHEGNQEQALVSKRQSALRDLARVDEPRPDCLAFTTRNGQKASPCGSSVDEFQLSSKRRNFKLPFF